MEQTIETNENQVSAQEVVIPENAGWYIIQTRALYEHKVASEIPNKLKNISRAQDLFELFIPEENVVSYKNGVKKESKKRLYPNYIFAHCVYSEEMWHAFKNISGFAGFLGDKKSPQTLSNKEIAEMKKNISGSARPKKEYKQGQKVFVKTGPFKDFYGTVVSADYEKNKIVLTVTIFGRETSTEMDLQDVELSA